MDRETVTEWPQDGDRLIAKGPDWHNNACLAQYYPDIVGVRLRGFAQAAEVLADRLAETNMELDILVYPLLFLYRHVIELALKGIIQDTLIAGGGAGLPEATHDLNRLWAKVRAFMENRWEDDVMRNAVAPFEALLDELASLDPDATAFRYALDKKGQAHLKGVTHVNVRHLEDMVGRMRWFLSACAYVTSRELEN